MIRHSLAILSLTSLPVSAQDVVFSPDHTLNCMAALPATARVSECFGTSANRCMADTPGGYSTVGEGACLSEEAAFWDGQLNATYQFLREQDGRQDTETGDFGPSQVEALREMQRAWITFRDATCAYEASQWGGGTGQGPAYAACLLRETASQTIYLQEQSGM